LGTAARHLVAWPLWLVHLSGSRVVRFSGCSRCVRFSGCPFVRLSICPSVLPSFRPSVLLSLWCTLTVCRSVLLSFCPSVLLVHLLDAVSKALGCSSARCGFDNETRSVHATRRNSPLCLPCTVVMRAKDSIMALIMNLIMSVTSILSQVIPM